VRPLPKQSAAIGLRNSSRRLGSSRNPPHCRNPIIFRTQAATVNFSARIRVIARESCWQEPTIPDARSMPAPSENTTSEFKFLRRKIALDANTHVMTDRIECACVPLRHVLRDRSSLPRSDYVHFNYYARFKIVRLYGSGTKLL